MLFEALKWRVINDIRGNMAFKLLGREAGTMLPTWQELFMELLLDTDHSRIAERVQAVVQGIVRRYSEPQPLATEERSSIDLALATMAIWTR